MSARRNVTTGLVVAAILGGSGYMAYTLAFPEQYDAPLPTRVWTVPTAPSAEASGPGTSTDGRGVVGFKPTLFAAFFTHGLEHVMQIQPVTVVYRGPRGRSPRWPRRARALPPRC